MEKSPCLRVILGLARLRPGDGGFGDVRRHRADRQDGTGDESDGLLGKGLSLKPTCHSHFVPTHTSGNVTGGMKRP